MTGFWCVDVRIVPIPLSKTGSLPSLGRLSMSPWCWRPGNATDGAGKDLIGRAFDAVRLAACRSMIEKPVCDFDEGEQHEPFFNHGALMILSGGGRVFAALGMTSASAPYPSVLSASEDGLSVASGDPYRWRRVDEST